MKDILQSRWKFLIKGWSIRKGLIESLNELEQLKADNQVGREGLRLAELEIAHLKTKLAHAEATSEKKHNYVRKLWGFIAASRRIDIPAANGTIRAALERAQRTIVFILCLLPMLGFSQALQRQFFTTNTAPNVVVTAGTNSFITFSLIGQQRTYRVDTPASGTATNIVWPVQGTNVYLTTNGLAIVIDVPSPLIPWQAITNITSIQIPASATTNAPWSLTGQTNLAITIAGTNVFVHSVTNLGVTTYTIDVPLQPQQTNWSWQSITNIETVQIPYSAITNPPAAGGQTNLALVVSGTNVFVSSVTNLGVTTFTIDVPATGGSGQTNLALVVAGTNAFVHSTTNSGVTTFTVDGPAVRTNWAITDITNSLNLTNWALLGTNLFLPVAGGTSTGPQVSTSATTNAPANDEFVTGGWVRNLFNVGVSYFSSTNIQVGATNADSPNQLVYQLQSTIPQVAARSYTTSDFLTNNGYLGSVVTTNTFLQLGGQVVVNAYLAYTGGASAPTVTLHPELYYSYDRTNWLGDWVAQGHTLTTGTTNLHQWVIDFQPTTSTNSTGFYVQRRYRCDGVSGAGVRTLWFLIGTNSASGTNDASHITVPVPSTSSLVYASNVVSGGQIPLAAVPMLARVVGITIDGGGSAITSGTKGFLEVPYAATIQSGTILADQVGSIQIETWRTNSGNLTLLARAGSLGTNWLTTTNWQRDVTLTGWSSVALAANDILGFTVTTNAASVTRATLQLKLQP